MSEPEFEDDDYDEGELPHLRDAITKRQNEMNELNDYRYRTLENMVRQKETEKREVLQKYELLKKDFDYNISLLKGRDDELRRYDDTFKNLKRVVVEKDQLTSELKASMFELETKLKNEQQRNNDLEIHYQEKMSKMKQERAHRENSQKSEYKKMLEEYERVISEKRMELVEKDRMVEEKVLGLKENHSLFLGEKEKEFKEQMTTIQNLKLENNKLRGEKVNSEKLFNSKIKIYENQILSLEEQIKNTERSFKNQLVEQKKMFENNEGDLEESYKERIDKLEKNLRLACSELENCKSVLTRKEQEMTERLKQKGNEIKAIRNDVEYQFNEKDKKVEQLENQMFSVELKEKTWAEKFENMERLLKQKDFEVEGFKEQLKSEITKRNQLKKEFLKVQLMAEHTIEKNKLDSSRKSDTLIKMLQRKNEELEEKLKMKDSEMQYNRMSQRRISRDKASRQQIERDLDEELGFSSLPPPSPVHSIKSVGQSQDRVRQLELRNTLLEEQNEKIKSTISQVRDEIQSKANHETENHLLRVQVEKLKEELAKSQFVQQQMKTEMHQLQEKSKNLITEEKLKTMLVDVTQNLRNESEITQVREEQQSFSEKNVEELTRLSSLLTDVRLDFEKQKDSTNLIKEKYLNEKMKTKRLHGKIKEAARDLKRILRDREKLMELNNMYKSELNYLKMQKKQKNSDIDEISNTLLKHKNEIRRLNETNDDLRRVLFKYSKNQDHLARQDPLVNLSRIPKTKGYDQLLVARGENLTLGKKKAKKKFKKYKKRRKV